MPVKSDIFGYKRNPKPRNVFSSSGAIMRFGKGKASEQIGNLVQNWNVNYNNNITEIFELGSDRIYWAQGRPTGTGTIGRIIGVGNAALFPAEALDVCKGGTLMEIDATASVCSGQTESDGVTLRMDGCIVTQIGFQANVADTRINETISWRFSTLEVPQIAS